MKYILLLSILFVGCASKFQEAESKFYDAYINKQRIQSKIDNKRLEKSRIYLEQFIYEEQDLYDSLSYYNLEMKKYQTIMHQSK